MYMLLWLNLERSSLWNYQSGRELSFPRKYEIISLVFYLYSLVTNVRREEGGEKNVENESIIIVAARTLITMKRVWKMC